MEMSTSALMGMAALATAGLALWACYQWGQRRRVRRVERWVGDYLVARYAGLPDRLHIHCSDDPLWPVLVDFADPHTGIRHDLQFSCTGPQSTLWLLSEKEEKRQGGLPHP